jgi:hypothetical protein
MSMVWIFRHVLIMKKLLNACVQHAFLGDVVVLFGPWVR